MNCRAGRFPPKLRPDKELTKPQIIAWYDGKNSVQLKFLAALSSLHKLEIVSFVLNINFPLLCHCC